jgi:hypothetical protein
LQKTSEYAPQALANVPEVQALSSSISADVPHTKLLQVASKRRPSHAAGLWQVGATA